MNIFIILSLLPLASQRRQDKNEGVFHFASMSIFRFSCRLLKKKTGLKIFTEEFEFSYWRMQSREQTRFRRAINLGKLDARSGKSHSILFIISQKEKSATVMQPKYQSSCLQFLSISSNLGRIFSYQQNSGVCCGVRTLQLVLFIWQMSPMMLSLISCLLLNMSNLIRSRTQLPSRESRSALRTRYSIMPCWPVTTKSPSLRQGRPFIIQSLASVRSNYSHSSGVKKRSRKGNSRYWHRRRQTWALALIPKYPITMQSS